MPYYLIPVNKTNPTPQKVDLSQRVVAAEAVNGYVTKEFRMGINEQAPTISVAGKKAWIVVASGRVARVFEEDAKHGLRLIDKIICTRGHALRHHAAKLEGVGPDDAAFICEVGEWLRGHAEKGLFETFAVVAEEKVLPHLKMGFGGGFEHRMARHIDYGLDDIDDDTVVEKLCNIMYF